MKRWGIWIGALLVVSLVCAAFLFPYALKRYIERNSEAWIGRRVSIGSIVLNPFTGVYAVHDLVCSEPQDEQVFVRFDKLGIKGSVLDGLLNDHWSFREAELRGPYVHIVQQGDRFNFSDLLEMAGEEEVTEVDKDTSEVAFTVTDIALTDGRIDYQSDLLHAPLHVMDLEVRCTRITSGNARMDFTVGLGMPDGTRLDGGFMIDTDSSRYAVDARLRAFDLAGSLPYLQDFFKASHLAGKLDLDLHVLQSYADSSQVALSARMELRDLAIKDDEGAHLLSVGQLRAALDTLVGDHFELGAIEVDGMDLRFALLADSTDNWTRLLELTGDSADGPTVAASESNYLVLMAEYVSYLGSAVTASEYAADSIVLRNGKLLFEDHTVPKPLRYAITDIAIKARRFTTESGKAPVTATATLNEVGRMEVRADFDPKDLRNVDLFLRVDSLMMADLDPYVDWYGAHPALDGMVRYETTTSIRDGRIDSRNQLYIDRLKFGKRHDEHAPGIVLLPLRLAAGLLKDAKGVIELDLPVKGDLRDPQFKVWPIVWQVLKNLIIKAVTAPAKLITRLFEGVEEKDLEQVRFELLQGHLRKEQRHTLDQLAKALTMKPDLRVDLVPVVDSVSEATELALFKARAGFLFPATGPMNSADSALVLGTPPNDSLFVQWLDAQGPASSDLSIGERCIQWMGREAAVSAWRELEYARREHVMQYLLSAGISAARLRYRTGTTAEVAHHRGVPGYLFIYDVEP